MKKKYILLICLILFVSCSYVLAPTFSNFITINYNKVFYLYLDNCLHYLTNNFSFSVGDIFYLIVVILIGYKIVYYLKKKQFKDLIYFIVTAVLLFFSFFQLFWGYNNYKISVAEQLNLQRNYTKEDLDFQTEKLIEIVNNEHYALTNDTLKKITIEKDLDLFNQTAKENYRLLPYQLKNILTQNNINTVKPSLYSKLLSYTGFSGYFNPFTHENQVNIEVPTIGMPITVAHEMAHQLGIASETEANFYGYQVMLLSKNKKFRYAAQLYALKYCLKQYRNENEETYQLLFKRLNYGVQQNIIETEEFWASKRNVSSYFFKNLYGRFLVINNQKDGIQSYNKFVDLLINYNKKYVNN